MLKFLVRSAFRMAIASYNTPERKGARGENLVNRALNTYLDESFYRVLSDIILPNHNGTTQIDHLIVSRYGIFVVETKNMSGWIFGNQNQAKWTQVQKGGRRLCFQNPFRQNFAHVKAVQKLLGVDLSTLHNFVVFTGSAVPKTDMPSEVAWGLKDLGRLISLRNKAVFSDAEVTMFEKQLKEATFGDTREARARHISNLEMRSESKQYPKPAPPLVSEIGVICPECGAEMVKRINRKTGDVFLGCSGFPRCRSTRQFP